MSILRVGEIDLNDAGNASVVLANSWNVAITTSGVIRLEARTDGSVVVPGSLVVGGQSIGGVNVQTFNTTGTWSKPAGFGANSRVYIQAWAGGGSGGCSASASQQAGGGGGGYMEDWLLLSALGATETITIGSGGASRTPTTAGATGGNTTVGSLVTAYGGAGGSIGLGGVGGGGGGPFGIGVGEIPGPPTISIDVNNGVQQGMGGTSQSGHDVNRDAIFQGGGGGLSGAAVATGTGILRFRGANSVYCGAGGGGGASNIGGFSQYGGNGGASGTNGTAGSRPAGGGGAGTSTSGAGGDGQVIITVFAGPA